VSSRQEDFWALPGFPSRNHSLEVSPQATGYSNPRTHFTVSSFLNCWCMSFDHFLKNWWVSILHTSQEVIDFASFCSFVSFEIFSSIFQFVFAFLKK